MYHNLDAEMARNKIEVADIARVIGKDKRTAYNKLTGVTGLLLEEARAIRDNLFPNLEFGYLFAKDEDAEVK